MKLKIPKPAEKLSKDSEQPEKKRQFAMRHLLTFRTRSKKRNPQRDSFRNMNNMAKLSVNSPSPTWRNLEHS